MRESSIGGFFMSHKKIAIALPTEEKLIQPLYHWGERFDWSHIQETHIVHVVKKNITPLEFGLIEMPDENTYQEMLPTLDKYLREEAQKIIPKEYSGEVFFHLTRDFSPEEEMIRILKKTNVGLIVVSTRGKHGFAGLFHSSFTDQMVKFSPCDVYVVRPEAE
jgi:nucleotide-binding universal stress UspA family protein